MCVEYCIWIVMFICTAGEDALNRTCTKLAAIFRSKTTYTCNYGFTSSSRLRGNLTGLEGSIAYEKTNSHYFITIPSFNARSTDILFRSDAGICRRRHT